MVTPSPIAHHLASAFVLGQWDEGSLVDRGADALGQRWRWLRPLVRRMIESLGRGHRPSRARVYDFLLGEPGFIRACRRHNVRHDGLQRKHAEMAPALGRPESWSVPSVVSEGELADWLAVEPAKLDWFADRRGLERKLPDGPLRHYRYHWLSKRIGGSARLIESPKSRLKAMQRHLLRALLDNIPTHRAAHGFTRGRSIKTFVAPHVGQRIVLRADLRDFFPSVSKHRVVAVFRTAGYPEDVCQTLGALCTNQVPDDVWDSFPQYGTIHDLWRHRELYRRPHLPQGAPTSPAIANLCCFRLDCRLEGLAHSFGGQYARYADDLLFSGGSNLVRSIRHFRTLVGAIVLDEGFEVNARKTRVLPQSVRQSAAGLTINAHANLARDEFDRLKAALHNCVHKGPAKQNRSAVPDFRAHLEGRVSFVQSVNATRGGKLRALFEQIDWSGSVVGS